MRESRERCWERGKVELAWEAEVLGRREGRKWHSRKREKHVKGSVSSLRWPPPLRSCSLLLKGVKVNTGGGA